MALYDSAKEREVEFDLVWYWCHSSADCGIKSNYQSMINVAIYGASTDFNDPFNSFVINSVDHRRQIEETLFLLQFETQKILYATYADVRLDPQIQMIFSKYTGAAYCNTVYKGDLDILCRKFHLGSATDKEKEIISQIRLVSTRDYHEAVDLYLAAKGRIVSEETKLKLRLANLGKKASEEAKKKMSMAHKGKLKTLQENNE